MNKFLENVKRMTFAATLLVSTILINSCSKLIKDDEGDCNPRFDVEFVYDYNMKYVDAFSREVRHICLYIFDENGKLVDHLAEDGDILATPGYKMQLRLAPGRYTFLAWGAGEEGFDSYKFTATDNHPSLQDMKCAIKDATSPKPQGTGLIGRLYHGLISCELVDREAGSISDIDTNHQTIRIPMVKDTNIIKVVLQCLSDEIDIDAKDYRAEISYDNATLDYQNNKVDAGKIVYRPYFDKTSEHDATYDNSNYEHMPALEMEFSVNRLFAADKSKARLTIYDKEDKQLLSIPLIDYILMMKSHGNGAMNNQEYLDRDDQFNFVFFIKGGKWLASEVIINSYRIVLQDVDLGSDK